MTFNSFTVTNDYNFGAQWPNDSGPRFFLPTEKNFQLSQRNYFKRSCDFFLYLKSFCKKRYKL